MLFLEPMTGKKQTVRTLTHFIPHGKPTSRHSDQGSRDRTQSSGPSPNTGKPSKEIMGRLGPRQLVVYAKALRAAGITNPALIPEDLLDEAREIAVAILNEKE
jgi:hypothetical protein